MNANANANSNSIHRNGNGSSSTNGHVPAPARFTGKDIRILRRALSLTQAAFASQLAVSRITVTRWERGHQQPLPEHVQLLSQLHDLNSRALVAPRGKDATE